MTYKEKLVGWTNTIVQGDVLEVLGEMPEGCCHAVISSPPYWGLRDYKIPGRQWSDGWFGSHGLELTLEAFVAHEVEALRAIRRVLRDDGIVLWNLGDSYSGAGVHAEHHANKGISNAPKRGAAVPTPVSPGLKPLDLCGVPWRVALAAQADGWYLRSAIIYAKGESFNPDRRGSVMPESVEGTKWGRCRVKVDNSKRDPNKSNVQGDSRHNPDSAAKYIDCPGCEKCSATHGFVLREGSWRPTSAYEMVFMLTKTDSYYCDGVVA